MATALIQLGTSTDAECSAWSTLSGSAVTQIVITASGGASDREARALYNALLATVRRTGARWSGPNAGAASVPARNVAGPLCTRDRCGGFWCGWRTRLSRPRM